MAVYPVAALELESLRRLPLDEILRINPLVHKIILNKLKYNPEQMKKLIEYNPFVPEELQGSLLQAAKRVMIDYGTYRRWTYFPGRSLSSDVSAQSF